MRLQENDFPLDYEKILFEELILLCQGNNIVDEYMSKFHEHSLHSRIVETNGNR